MSLRRKILVWLLVGSPCLAGSVTAAEPAPSAALQCEVMASLSHDSASVAGQECHDLRHDGDADVCRRELDACAQLCLE